MIYDVTTAIGRTFRTLPDYDTKPERPYVTLYEGVRELAKRYNCTAEYIKGCEINEEIAGGIKEAVKAAKSADILLFACGDNIQLAAEGCDRADLRLPKAQRKLFAALYETGKQIITALICTKPLCVPELDEQSAAVLTNFNGGMFGGLALAEAIFGEINPCGKLPISFPYHIASGKQTVIALDKQQSYTQKTSELLEKYSVLKLAPNGEELFGRSWGKRTKGQDNSDD